MKEKSQISLELPAVEESFEEMRLFFRNKLDGESISKEIVSETMLVVEALFHNILAQGVDGNTMLKLSCRNSLGNVVIRIDYKGKMAYLFTEEDDEISPENQILRAYEEKIDNSYRFGYNIFQITVRRKHFRALLYCAIGILFALLAYIPMRFLMSQTSQYRLAVDLLLPMQQLFGNAALMIGAPVTFFSLLKNLTNTYILSDRDSSVRKLRLKTMATSVITVLIAIGMSFLLRNFYLSLGPSEPEEAMPVLGVFSKLISEAVPPSIFTPFESVSPIPLIVVALILTYAFCSSGKYFSKLKGTVDICYTVFSKMLGLVLFALPFFFFVTILGMLITAEFETLWVMILIILLTLASAVGLLLFYLIRLKLGGVKLRPFLRKLPPLLLENYRINSSIDAVPFNIRYCVRNYGMDRRRLEKTLPFFAQSEFDGNSFLLMSIGMFLIFASGTGITWYNILVLALLVFFLSLGAPNQPGSILIGTLILLQYLGIEISELFIPILFEVGLGLFQNLINVTGDIVTVAIIEQKLQDHAPAA